VLGKLDGGTDAAGPAPRHAMSGRQDLDFGGCGVQERGTSAAMTNVIRVSVFR